MRTSFRTISAIAVVAATSSSALLSIPNGASGGGSTGGITSGLSIGCQAALSGLISSSSAACLSLNVFLSNVGGLGANASAVNGLNGWLVNGVCNRAACSDSDVKATQNTVNSGCASDISSSTFNGAKLVNQLLENYSAVRQGGCLQDSKNSSSLCLSESMYIVEQKGDTTLTLDKLTSLISNATAGSAIVNQLSPKNSICTDCTHALKTVLIPSSSTGSSFGKTISNTCGSSFDDGQIPSTVVQASLDGTSSGSTSGTSTSKSGSAPTSSSTKAPDAASSLGSTKAAVAGLAAALLSALALL